MLYLNVEIVSITSGMKEKLFNIKINLTVYSFELILFLDFNIEELPFYTWSIW